MQSLLASLADNTAVYGGLHALDGLLAVGIAGSVCVGLAVAAMTAAGLAAPAGAVSAGRRAARISAGTGVAVALAALAGAALTFIAADDFKGNDLVFNLAALASAVAYAAWGRWSSGARETSSAGSCWPRVPGWP